MTLNKELAQCADPNRLGEKIMEENSEKNTAKDHSASPSWNNGEYLSRLMAVSGYVLLIVTGGLVSVLGFKYFSGKYVIERLSENDTLVSFLVQHYTYEFLLLLGALITGHFALRLIFGANPNTAEVIPQKDRTLLEPLIKEANKEAINQYVILSSLSGFTGTFQKIGFSGLPLATVTLTLVFSFLSFFQQEFMELAKLTLGAFIGSFVQKGQDELKIAKEANEVGANK